MNMDSLTHISQQERERRSVRETTCEQELKETVRWNSLLDATHFSLFLSKLNFKPDEIDFRSIPRFDHGSVFVDRKNTIR